ncbi:MAG: hypothetical protein ACRDNH_12780 [Gaiellaceae bacterium]
MYGWERWAAATGLGFVAAATIGFLIRPRPPAADETSAEILDFFVTNEAEIRWQSFFFGLAGMFLLWFGGTLAAALRRAENDPAGRLPAIVVASAAAGAALFWLGVTSWAAVAAGIDELNGANAYALYHLGSVAFVITDFPAAVFVWAASVGISRTRLLPDPAAWLGLIAGAGLVLNAAGRLLLDEPTFAPGGAVGTGAFLLFVVWVLVVSAVLAWRDPAPARTQPES